MIADDKKYSPSLKSHIYNLPISAAAAAVHSTPSAVTGTTSASADKVSVANFEIRRSPLEGFLYR